MILEDGLGERGAKWKAQGENAIWCGTPTVQMSREELLMFIGAMCDTLNGQGEQLAQAAKNREMWQKSEEGTLAQMAETNERFEGALSTIRKLEAQRDGLRIEIKDSDALIAELRAQLAEAEKTLRKKEDGQIARHWMNRFDKAEAKFDTAIQQLTLANQVNRELAARAEKAEAELD